MKLLKNALLATIINYFCFGCTTTPQKVFGFATGHKTTQKALLKNTTDSVYYKSLLFFNQMQIPIKIADRVSGIIQSERITYIPTTMSQSGKLRDSTQYMVSEYQLFKNSTDQIRLVNPEVSAYIQVIILPTEKGSMVHVAMPVFYKTTEPVLRVKSSGVFEQFFFDFLQK